MLHEAPRHLQHFGAFSDGGGGGGDQRLGSLETPSSLHLLHGIAFCTRPPSEYLSIGAIGLCKRLFWLLLVSCFNLDVVLD